MLSQRINRARADASGTTPLGFRSVSKMLGVYLDDVDQLVQADEPVKALQLAVLLPHIIAALQDPVIRGSCAAADAWVDQWLVVDGDAARIAELRPCWHRDCRGDAQNSGTMEAGIKQLRLRRHSRESLATSVVGTLAPISRDLRLAYDVVSAAREWYSECGIDEPRVQENLARLAILR